MTKSGLAGSDTLVLGFFWLSWFCSPRSVISVSDPILTIGVGYLMDRYIISLALGMNLHYKILGNLYIIPGHCAIAVPQQRHYGKIGTEDCWWCNSFLFKAFSAATSSTLQKYWGCLYYLLRWSQFIISNPFSLRTCATFLRCASASMSLISSCGSLLLLSW